MKKQSLREFRKINNLSVKEMSESLKISKSYYEKIEYGDRNPSYNFQCKFKQKYPDAEVDFFLT